MHNHTITMRAKNKKENPYYVQIGEEIKKIFNERCINQAMLARKLCCHNSNITKILTRSSIDTELLLNISLAIGVNLFEPYTNIIEERLIMPKMYFTGVPSVFAGEHPSIKKSETATRERVEALCNNGFTDFVDLTECDELPPYSKWLSKGCNIIDFPIKNQSFPQDIKSTYNLIQSIAGISDANDGRKVYIHCYGGAGRTGTIVACLLSYHFHDYDYDSVMKRFQTAYKEYPKSSYLSAPETTEQENFIAEFIKYVRFPIL